MYYLLFIYSILSVYGERDLFEKKCTRECNTEYGTLDCWERTTNGFTYGLSTAMIDYCQILIQLNNQSWYNTSHDILIQQIEEYNLNKQVRQLTKDDIKQISLSLLNKCLNSPSIPSSFQPSCPSCSVKQMKLIQQLRIIIFSLAVICLLIIFVIIFLYILHRHTHRSYHSIN